MKKFLLSLVLLYSINGKAHSQIIRLHGFLQKTYGGAMQEPSIEENKNNLEQNNNEHNRFLLFAEIAKSKKIAISEVWVNGYSNAFTVDTIRSFPVVQFSSITKDTLIRYTKNRVLKILLLGKNNLSQKSSFFEKEISENSVVIVYLHKNKKRYAALKKIKTINPVFAP